MPISTVSAIQKVKEQGFSLIELIVFIVVISVALGGVLSIYHQSVANSVDPLIKLRAIELLQAQLDEILSRKYDTNTPSGGIPACGPAATLCDPFNAADAANCDDVDDFNDPACTLASPYPGYTISVSVQHAGPGAGSGADLPNLTNANAAKLITVSVMTPDSLQYSMSAYRSNF